MRQLVGTSCVRCGERISSIMDGRFCELCGRPVHLKCTRPEITVADKSRCPECGAEAEQSKQEQLLHEQERRQRQADSSGRNRFAYVAGIIGFSLMSLRGVVSTLDPKPDGRLLNTAPAIGVDVFLVIGLLGIIYFAVKLARSI